MTIYMQSSLCPARMDGGTGQGAPQTRTHTRDARPAGLLGRRGGTRDGRNRRHAAKVGSLVREEEDGVDQLTIQHGKLDGLKRGKFCGMIKSTNQAL